MILQWHVPSPIYTLQNNGLEAKEIGGFHPLEIEGIDTKNGHM